MSATTPQKRPTLAADYWWAFSPHEARWVLMVVAEGKKSEVRSQKSEIVVRYAIAIHGWPLWFKPDWAKWNQWQAAKEQSNERKSGLTSDLRPLTS